jgi:fructuronate reductase
MSGKERLSGLSGIASTASVPAYSPEEHGCGIVHLGVGAFHKAHQAVYTDDALVRSGGNWRIVGASLRSADVADALNPQNGFYTLLERGQGGTSARVIGSIATVIAANREPEALLAAMANAETKIVSLTVTEKAYGIIREKETIDPWHPAIAHDLERPHAPQGALGYIVRALQLRRQAGTSPFTVLCCDNLPENGKLLKAGVLDFAGRIDPGLRDWIAGKVTFPSTMVDRITPASTDRTFADAEALTGFADLAAVETEPFTQWVIEDDFVAGRPDWEAGGAIFTDNVTPYEHMKLRMLNGSHSMMAYAGFLSGKTYVRDVMTSPALKKLVERHFAAAAATLDPLPGIDFADYASQLGERFSNPAIAHETYQIAMDGSQKMPQRIFAPALVALERHQDIEAFAFATAIWVRYCLGRKDDGSPYDIRDPMADSLGAVFNGHGGTAEDIYFKIAGIRNLIPFALSGNANFQTRTISKLRSLLEQGVVPTIEAEAAGLS